MRQAAGPLSRKVTRSAERLDLLIFTEGEQTETSYLRYWHREFRDRVAIVFDSRHGGPKQLVEWAASRKRDELRSATRGGGQAFGQVWCVFDIDAHPQIPEAIDMAHANDIHLAISSPCIELWFVLHFANQTAHIERGDIQRRSRELLSCEKRLTATADRRGGRLARVSPHGRRGGHGTCKK